MKWLNESWKPVFWNNETKKIVNLFFFNLFRLITFPCSVTRIRTFIYWKIFFTIHKIQFSTIFEYNKNSSDSYESITGVPFDEIVSQLLTSHTWKKPHIVLFDFFPPVGCLTWLYLSIAFHSPYYLSKKKNSHVFKKNKIMWGTPYLLTFITFWDLGELVNLVPCLWKHFHRQFH